jgi:hypothetical protein
LPGLDSLVDLSNSLHDENDDAYDNDGSNDPVSEHFDSPLVFLCAVITLECPVGTIHRQHSNPHVHGRWMGRQVSGLPSRIKGGGADSARLTPNDE